MPSSIAASPEAYIANLRYVGTWIRPGDNIKRDGDGAEFYRVIDTLESGDAASSSYFGLAKLSAEYGGLTSPTDDDTADGVQWVPLVRDGGSIFVDFTSAGGQASPSDQNAALSSLREVAATYLSRSSGIRVDFDALSRATWLDRFTVDAHLTDPGASTGWLMGEVFAALPVVGAWLGGGLTFVDVDPTATAFVADLDVGRDGRDGDRLSMVTTQDPTVVINAVTVRYGFDESTGKFEGYIYTASRRYAPGRLSPGPSSSTIAPWRRKRPSGAATLRSNYPGRTTRPPRAPSQTGCSTSGTSPGGGSAGQAPARLRVVGCRRRREDDRQRPWALQRPLPGSSS